MTEHWSTNPQQEDDVIEYRRVMERDLIKSLKNVVNETLKAPQYDKKNFYITVIFKHEILGTIKPLIFARISCPTPVYNQNVWKYDRSKDQIQFLWAIPSARLYKHILANGKQFLQDAETKDLTKFVLLMESGELLRWVKKENGEDKIDNIVIKVTKEKTDD